MNFLINVKIYISNINCILKCNMYNLCMISASFIFTIFILEFDSTCMIF